jgi:hypothetical protein
MGLSYEDACRLGLAHEHPDHPSRRGQAPPAILPTDTNPPERTRLPKVNDKGQNKTEARFDALLAGLLRDGEIRWYAFEALTLRLAGNTRYTPDFALGDADGGLVFVEVKGFMREDAAVKTKVAAAQFPWARFFVAFAEGKGFDVRPVTARGGIGRRSVGEWWRARIDER